MLDLFFHERSSLVLPRLGKQLVRVYEQRNTRVTFRSVYLRICFPEKRFLKNPEFPFLKSNHNPDRYLFLSLSLYLFKKLCPRRGLVLYRPLISHPPIEILPRTSPFTLDTKRTRTLRTRVVRVDRKVRPLIR